MPKLAQALEMVGLTHTGQVREHNEDAILFLPEHGLLLLADGMGGYNAGEIASAMAIDAMSDSLLQQLQARPPQQAVPGAAWPAAHEMLLMAIDRANSMIYEAACNQPQCAGMGTTLVAAILFDNRLAVAHVGDSRLYRWRAGELEQLTRDHSLLQERIDAGLIAPHEARYAQDKNLLTRAVGIGPYVETELREYVVEVGDVYLACSDGLTDMLEDESIGELLQVLGHDLPLAAQTLLSQANAAGGRDNISLILVRIEKDFAVHTGLGGRIKRLFGAG